METGEILSTVSKRLEKFISYHSYRFARVSNLEEKEDFEAIAQETVWLCISRFKPVCNVCKKKFKDVDAFERHHHKEMQYSFLSYVKSRILSNFGNQIKNENALKRKPKSLRRFAEGEARNLSCKNYLNYFDFMDLVLYISNQLEKKEREILFKLLKDYKVSEIIMQERDINKVNTAIVKIRKKIRLYCEEKGITL